MQKNVTIEVLSERPDLQLLLKTPRHSDIFIIFVRAQAY